MTAGRRTSTGADRVQQTKSALFIDICIIITRILLIKAADEACRWAVNVQREW
jgi:hypothetical protein